MPLTVSKIDPHPSLDLIRCYFGGEWAGNANRPYHSRVRDGTDDFYMSRVANALTEIGQILVKILNGHTAHEARRTLNMRAGCVLYL